MRRRKGLPLIDSSGVRHYATPREVIALAKEIWLEQTGCFLLNPTVQKEARIQCGVMLGKGNQELDQLILLMVKALLVKEGIVLVHPYNWEMLYPNTNSSINCKVVVGNAKLLTIKEFMSFPDNKENLFYTENLPAIPDYALLPLLRKWTPAIEAMSVLTKYNPKVHNDTTLRGSDHHFVLGGELPEEDTLLWHWLRKIGPCHTEGEISARFSRRRKGSYLKPIQGMLREIGLLRWLTGELRPVAKLLNVEPDLEHCKPSFRTASFMWWIKKQFETGIMHSYNKFGLSGEALVRSYQVYREHWAEEEDNLTTFYYQIRDYNLTQVIERYHYANGGLKSLNMVRSCNAKRKRNRTKKLGPKTRD